MKFSIRELLIVIAFVAIGCAAMTYASTNWWTAVATLAYVVTIALAVVACVDRGGTRAFAIGFLICGLAYFAVLHMQETTKGYNYEFTPNSIGKLPSTNLLSMWYSSIQQEMIDPNTSEVVSTPPSKTFMRIGHTLVMLMLGYVGGLFGRFVYMRRMRDARIETNEAS